MLNRREFVLAAGLFPLVPLASAKALTTATPVLEPSEQPYKEISWEEIAELRKRLRLFGDTINWRKPMVMVDNIDSPEGERFQKIIKRWTQYHKRYPLLYSPLSVCGMFAAWNQGTLAAEHPGLQVDLFAGNRRIDPEDPWADRALRDACVDLKRPWDSQLTPTISFHNGTQQFKFELFPKNCCHFIGLECPHLGSTIVEYHRRHGQSFLYTSHTRVIRS